MLARRIRIFLLLSALAFAASARPVWAQSSNWTIDEVYSNSTANVQFVELSDTVDGETFLAGQTLTSNGQAFTFPSDLPSGTSTLNGHMLLATPGYFALAGVAAADYMLPDHFFNAVGDTIIYGGGLDSVTFGNFQFPLDNVNSLNRATPGDSLVSGINSPTNSAGQGGQIPPWENQDKPLDVDGNGRIEPHDLALVINNLLDNGSNALSEPTSGHRPPPFVDVNGDNFVRPSDANTIITFLLDNPTSAAVPMEAFSGPAASTSMMSVLIENVPEPGGGILALSGAGLLGGYGFVIARKRRKNADEELRGYNAVAGGCA